MNLKTWVRSRLVLCLACVVLPPLGALLLWIRPSLTLTAKSLLTLPLLAMGAFQLVFFFGLRLEFDGSGVFPLLSFHEPNAHYDELELSRRKQPVADASSILQTGASSDGELKSPAANFDSGATGHGSTAALAASGWTDFRGPKRDGHYREMPVLTRWPRQGLKPLWRQPVGGGYASFVLAGGRAFTIEQRRHQEVAAAYDVKTGTEIWTYSWDASFQESLGGDGPRATPTWDAGRIYALGATGELHCLDAKQGTLIWSRNILQDNQASNLTWGMSASPLIVEEKVIVLPGGPGGKSVVAYHKETGAPLWKALDDKQAYTSPMWVTLAGRPQLLIVSAKRMMGLSAEDGSLLWDYPWVTDYGINSAQPIVLGKNRIFISAGYGHGAAVVEVNQTPQGYQARTVWQNRRMKNKFTSSVLRDGFIYGLDEAILACVQAGSGELQWKGGRYGHGQVLLAGGHLIVLTESGDLVLVEADPERRRELTRFSAIRGKTWNHPAISGGLLLVRNTREMACFDLRLR